MAASLRDLTISACFIGAVTALLLGLYSVSAQSSSQSIAVVTTYITRWHIPDLCNGERDYEKCSVSFALTADGAMLYAFIYQTSKLYQFTGEKTYNVYDLSKFFPYPGALTQITPFGRDFVLINTGHGLYKYHLAAQSISEVAKGQNAGFSECFASETIGLYIVCFKTGRDTLNLGLLNPYTEQWSVLAKDISGSVPDWLVLLAGHDNMVYIQWNMDVPAFSFSKVGVIDATFRTLTVRDKTWTEHRIPVTQLRDWSKEHLSLEPGPVEVFLIAVDSHSNRYFSLYWNENVKNNLKPKSHYDLFKLSPDDKLIWYLPDTPLQLLDVSPSGSLIVAETDPTNRTTDIIEVIVKSVQATMTATPQILSNKLM